MKIPTKEEVADGIGLEFFKAVKNWQQKWKCPVCNEPKLDISTKLKYPIFCRNCISMFTLESVSYVRN